MIGFHTPVFPAPLGLDLAELVGGGSCPAQFFGKTHGGLEVYGRYRGGSLRVHVARAPGTDAVYDGTCILAAEIGPPLDGSMSLTQFCATFGVTINGTVPEETDPDAHRYSNLTGQITFWQAHLSQITIETARSIVAKACSLFPDALLVKPVRNDRYRLERLELTTPEGIDTLNVWLVDGPALLTEIEHRPEEGVMPRSDQLKISIIFSSWQYPAPIYTSPLRQAVEDLGRKYFVPGECNMPKEMELATDSLSVTASFATGDQAKRDALASLGDAISRQLPMSRLERVDLATGDVVGEIERPIDPVILRWCDAGSDRWISITREHRSGPWVGIRPARTD